MVVMLCMAIELLEHAYIESLEEKRVNSTQSSLNPHIRWVTFSLGHAGPQLKLKISELQYSLI